MTLWVEPPRSLDEIVAEAEAFIDEARTAWHPQKWFVLFSGGRDSLVMLALARLRGWAPDGVVHVNTGTGVPETTEFVRRVCRDWGLVLHELTPPKTFEELFLEDPIIDGLPGPGMHRVAYSRLKERPLRRFSTEQKTSWNGKVALLTGIRHDESEKRMGYGDSIVDVDRCRCWVNPIYRVTDAEMTALREQMDLPVNEVSQHLHISGECLCGCFARPGELDEIRFFYPEVAERIEEWQRRAEERGLTYCQWGQRRSGAGRDDGGRLCRACVTRQMSLDELLGAAQ